MADDGRLGRTGSVVFKRTGDIACGLDLEISFSCHDSFENSRGGGILMYDPRRGRMKESRVRIDVR